MYLTDLACPTRETVRVLATALPYLSAIYEPQLRHLLRLSEVHNATRRILPGVRHITHKREGEMLTDFRVVYSSTHTHTPVWFPLPGLFGR